MPTSRVTLVSAREKMPFQVTPLMPYLSRLDANGDPIRGTPSAAGGVAVSEKPQNGGTQIVDRK
jgi:hypothetical protein